MNAKEMAQINVIISAPTNKVLTSVFVRRDINFTLTAQAAKVRFLKSYLIGKSRHYSWLAKMLVVTKSRQ